MTKRAQQRFGVAVGAAVVLGVALRVVFVAAWAQPLPDPGDAVAYHLLADGLADGDGYVRPYDRRDGVEIATAEYGPAWPAVLAVADAAGVDTTWGQRFFGAVMGGAAIAMTALAGRSVAGARAGVVAASIVAVHPLVVGHDTTLLTEGLVVLAGATVLLVAPRHALVAGAVVGVAGLVRADALLLFGVVVVASWGRWRQVAWAALAVAAVVLPWTVRNAVRLDAFVPVSTNAGSAVGGANCGTTYAGSLRGYWAFRRGCFDGYDRRSLVASGEASVAADEVADGVGYARSHTGALPRVVVARVARLWGVWDVDQQVYLAALEGKSPRWERAGTVFGWALAALALVGLVVTAQGSGRRAMSLLAAPLVAVTLTGALVYGNPRFRAAAEPAIAVLAAVAVTGRSRS